MVFCDLNLMNRRLGARASSIGKCSCGHEDIDVVGLLGLRMDSIGSVQVFKTLSCLEGSRHQINPSQTSLATFFSSSIACFSFHASFFFQPICDASSLPFCRSALSPLWLSYDL